MWETCYSFKSDCFTAVRHNTDAFQEYLDYSNNAWCLRHSNIVIPIIFPLWQPTPKSVGKRVLWTRYCFLWQCQRRKLQPDRFGVPAPSAALLCSALICFGPAVVSLPALCLTLVLFLTIQHLTHSHLHYWTADITDWHSPHLQRRGLAVGFWHQRVWNDVRELDFGHGEHENLLCTLLTSSSAPPAFTIISATRFISLNQPQAYYEHPYRNGVTLEISKRCCWCACRPLWLLLMVAFVDSSTGDLLFKWIFSDKSAVCRHLWVSLSSLDTPRLRLIPTRSPKFCPRFKKK